MVAARDIVEKQNLINRFYYIGIGQAHSKIYCYDTVSDTLKKKGKRKLRLFVCSLGVVMLVEL